MTKEAYMLMLIDSLEVYQSNDDTVNMIRCAAVLTTQLHGSKARLQAKYYADLAYMLALSYQKENLVPDLCNRYGMLYFAFSRHYLDGNPVKSKVMLDSAIYWHTRALKEGNRFTVGWANRGLLACYIREADQFGHKQKELIAHHYEQIVQVLREIDDPQLFDHSSLLYAKYLIDENRLAEAARIVREIDNYGTSPDKRNMYSYYHRIHSLISKQNDLDTLITLYWKMLYAFEQRTRLAHNIAFHEKDQKFKVSQTKDELIATNHQLSNTQRNLFLSIATGIVFFSLSGYLVFISRRNKRLSTRNELLLKEQNHRVKNNLQMINSLLSLQSEKLLSTDAKEALNESQMRINSVALLHRMLYERENIGKVNAREYLTALVDEISYASPRRIEISLRVDQEIYWTIERATSLGLIVNELLTNSIKHVSETNTLTASISADGGSDELVLQYSDNGEGVEEEVWKKSDSFGNQLIRIQSEQLRGNYRISSRNGFFYELKMGA